jgi:hypothetical protein
MRIVIVPTVFLYRLHATTGDDLGPIEHPAPNVETGDVVVPRSPSRT